MVGKQMRLCEELSEVQHLGQHGEAKDKQVTESDAPHSLKLIKAPLRGHSILQIPGYLTDV